jgi:hypothetical protein
LWRAYLTNLRHPFRLAKVAGKGVPAIGRLRTGRKEKQFRNLGEKERTRFNATISAHRVFGAVTYDLAEVRRVKTAVAGATVNDVMLTIVGGALYKYLEAKGETPERSLVRSLGAGPCMDNMGIIHPVTSYNGMIAVSFQACREMMPDPQFYEECLAESFGDLCAAVPVAGKKKTKRKTK